MVTRYEPHSAEVYRRLMALVRERHGAMVFSEDGSLVDEQVARLLRGGDGVKLKERKAEPPPKLARLLA